jgi:hypothetical protein
VQWHRIRRAEFSGFRNPQEGAFDLFDEAVVALISGVDSTVEVRLMPVVGLLRWGAGDASASSVVRAAAGVCEAP